LATKQWQSLAWRFQFTLL